MNGSSPMLVLPGLAMLVVGAEALVRGSVRIAAAARVPPLVIGLTVVAFGTSAPELVVSVRAGYEGLGGIALGNVLGSNIFNVLVVLGLSALIRPLAVRERLVRFDVPVMIGVSCLFFLIGAGGSVGRGEGLLLIALFILYTTLLIGKGRSEPAKGTGRPGGPGRLLVAGTGVVAGLALLVLGSRWLVDGATAAAYSLGVSDRVVGLTIVAAGTSLPELATSLVAAVRGERDIAVGNVVGSNVFNLLGVLGLAAALPPAGIAVERSMLLVDGPVMLVAALACLPVFFTGRTIARWEGGLFLAGFAAYGWVLYGMPPP
ncbi:MAG: calcium/sodium antiporter [Candidatus Eisenbacteria bacterium]